MTDLEVDEKTVLSSVAKVIGNDDSIIEGTINSENELPLSNLKKDQQHSVSDSLNSIDEEQSKNNVLINENEANKILKTMTIEADQEKKMDSEETQISSGTVLRNRFDLLEVLGQGGMGKVYKALDKRDVEAGNTEFIAIKIINEEYKDDSDLLKALHAEARKTQALAHPNIVRVYDFDRDGNTVYMTMEYIEGISLKKIIKAAPGGMKSEEVFHFVSQIASALVYAHSQHIIHLDLKPSNIFVDSNRHVKVFDFGISRVTNIFQTKGFDPGILGGLTPSYASLEMFQGQAPDPRDDIYALACITYELLTGHHPFNNERADIAKKKKLKPGKIDKLDAGQWKTLVRALAFDRNERIESVELFLQGMSNPQRKSKKPRLIAGLIFLALFPLSYFLYSQFGLFSKPETYKVKTESREVPPESAVKIGDDTMISEISGPELNKEDSDKERPSIDQYLQKFEASTDIVLSKNQPKYKIGDNLVFEFILKKPKYVSLAVINSENEISMLFPNPFQSDNNCKEDVKYRVPQLNAEYNISIGGPAGMDQVVAVMSEKPMVEGVLLNFKRLEQIKNYASKNNLEYAVTSYQVID